MSEPAQKCETNAIFKQIYVKNCSLVLKWPILNVLAEGKSRFSRFHPKKVLYYQLLIIIPTTTYSSTTQDVYNALREDRIIPATLTKIPHTYVLNQTDH